MTVRDCQERLLALLVMDLGYGTEDKTHPIYGHHPLRHQFAWEAATKGWDREDVDRVIAELRQQIKTEEQRAKAIPSRAK